MTKHYYISLSIILLVVLGLGFSVVSQLEKASEANKEALQSLNNLERASNINLRQADRAGAFNYPVTNSSTTIGTQSTNVVTSTQQWHYIRAVTGGQDIWCSAGEDAVVGEGARVSSSTSDTPLVIDRPSLTTKPLNCIAESTSTLSWYRF